MSTVSDQKRKYLAEKKEIMYIFSLAFSISHWNGWLCGGVKHFSTNWNSLSIEWSNRSLLQTLGVFHVDHFLRIDSTLFTNIHLQKGKSKPSPRRTVKIPSLLLTYKASRLCVKRSNKFSGRFSMSILPIRDSVSIVKRVKFQEPLEKIWDFVVIFLWFYTLS